MNIIDLPEDCIVEIYSHLDFKDKVCGMYVNKTMNKLLNKELNYFKKYYQYKFMKWNRLLELKQDNFCSSTHYDKLVLLMFWFQAFTGLSLIKNNKREQVLKALEIEFLTPHILSVMSRM